MITVQGQKILKTILETFNDFAYYSIEFYQHQWTPRLSPWKLGEDVKSLHYVITRVLNDHFHVLVAIMYLSEWWKSSRVPRCHPMDYWSKDKNEKIQENGYKYAPGFLHCSSMTKTDGKEIPFYC